MHKNLGNNEVSFFNLDVNRHFKQEDINLVLSMENIDPDNTIFQLEGDTLVVGYLTPEQDAGDFHYDQDETIEIFKTQNYRDEHFLKMQEEGRHPLLVDNYSHGANHYSIIGTVDYPDRQFDVSPRGVYTPSEYNRQELESGNITEKELINRANAALDAYSDWANGYVYTAVVEKFKFDKENEQWVSTDYLDTLGCIIGQKGAQQTLKDDMMTFSEIPTPEIKTKRAIEGPSL